MLRVPTLSTSPCLYAAAGVKESKLRIVPIAVNTSRFDPKKTLPFKLPKGQLIFGRHRRVISQARMMA